MDGGGGGGKAEDAFLTRLSERTSSNNGVRHPVHGARDVFNLKTFFVDWVINFNARSA